LRPEHVAVVIQRNPEGALPYREPVGTMLLFGSEVEPNLIPASALVEEFERLGFRLKLQQERPVADGKTMVGLLLEVTPA
jgi:hypothetical protein